MKFKYLNSISVLNKRSFYSTSSAPPVAVPLDPASGPAPGAPGPPAPGWKLGIPPGAPPID